MAFLLLATFYATMVAPGLIVEFLFQRLGVTRTTRDAKVWTAGVQPRVQHWAAGGSRSGDTRRAGAFGWGCWFARGARTLTLRALANPGISNSRRRRVLRRLRCEPQRTARTQSDGYPRPT
jgi:hypothetical protein